MTQFWIFHKFIAAFGYPQCDGKMPLMREKIASSQHTSVNCWLRCKFKCTNVVLTLSTTLLASHAYSIDPGRLHEKMDVHMQIHTKNLLTQNWWWRCPDVWSNSDVYFLYIPQNMSISFKSLLKLICMIAVYEWHEPEMNTSGFVGQKKMWGHTNMVDEAFLSQADRNIERYDRVDI